MHAKGGGGWGCLPLPAYAMKRVHMFALKRLFNSPSTVTLLGFDRVFSVQLHEAFISRNPLFL
jgi:hypothetical protein